jgi:hypothetical protein
MSSRMLTCLFASTALFSIGCDDSTGLSDNQAANVRVIHASATATTQTTPVDVAVNGQVAAGNSGIAFSGVGECVRVDADSPDLTIRQAGTQTVIATPTPFTAGGRNTVILSGPSTALRVTTITDASTPALQSGRARIRVFNGTTRPANIDVYVTPWNQPAAAVTATNIGQAAATEWLEVPSGGMVSVRLTNTGTQTNVDVINVGPLTSGQELTLVAVDPATGQTGSLRWVGTTPCEPAEN